MLRGSLLLALMGSMLAGACVAAEPAMCKSLCDAERKSCKAKTQELAREEYNGPLMLESRQRNELARTAGMTQGTTPAAQATERSNVDTRRMRYAAACEDTYTRCTRACAPAVAVPDSPVIIKRPAN